METLWDKIGGSKSANYWLRRPSGGHDTWVDQQAGGVAAAVVVVVAQTILPLSIVPPFFSSRPQLVAFGRPYSLVEPAKSLSLRHRLTQRRYLLLIEQLDLEVEIPFNVD